MKWPWRRKTSTQLDEAQAHIDRLEQQQPEVDRLTRELRAARSRNGFADMITAALKGTS